MVRVVKVTTDNRIQIVELQNWNCKYQEDAIGADCVEPVRTQIMMELFRDTICMLVDESGAVKGLPINRLASELYGTKRYGLIHGDVLFAIQVGPDILPYANPDLLLFFLKDNFRYLKEPKEVQP